MPFIPFSSSYKSNNNNNNNNNQLTMNPQTTGSSFQNSNAFVDNQGYSSGNSSGQNSSNNSPSVQQSSSFTIRRKPSVGNAIFNLVNSIRQPTNSLSPNVSGGSYNNNNNGNNGNSNPNSAGNNSIRQGLRRGSQSSGSRSRSTSFLLTKQISNPNSNNNNNNISNNKSNSTSNLNSNVNNVTNNDSDRDEVERANPFDTTPELLGKFQQNETNDDALNNIINEQRISNNSSTPQLTTIFSNNEYDDNVDPFFHSEPQIGNSNANANNNNTNNTTANSDSIQQNIEINLNRGTNNMNRFNDIHEVNENEESNEILDNLNNSISITNGDNSAHNTFNPTAYNFIMANSPTIPNFRVYENDGLLVNGVIQHGDIRTRGNTLREEPEQFEAVPMNTENNQTLGTAINNPITIDDTENFNSFDPNTVNMTTTTTTTGSGNGIVENNTNNRGNNNNSNNTNDVIIIDSPRSDENNNNNIMEIDRVEVVNNDIDNEEGIDGLDTLNTGYQNNTSNREEINYCDDNGFYSIRLTPSIDHSSTQPYMFFGPIIRKIKPNESIAIGRYTEKNKNAAKAAPGSSEGIVFKSKVVSRKHAEFSVDDKGRWYVKDVKSSSGTFLNHVRLSAPNEESPEVFMKDCDLLQLGVDYRGGSEEIFRCVKVKIEVNYSWKKRGAKFSKEAHKKLKKLMNLNEKEELTPCVICLDDIKPCQPVFVASCSHSWHYRCIRPLLIKTYPQFLCPNCKAICDLEADLDDEDDE